MSKEDKFHIKKEFKLALQWLFPFTAFPIRFFTFIVEILIDNKQHVELHKKSLKNGTFTFTLTHFFSRISHVF
jgi:hypothetical protein